MSRHQDGSAGDVNYEVFAKTYRQYRQPDPRIAAKILEALGEARTVLNVGAGAGSYEPSDLEVTAVEPSASMRALRPRHLSQAVDASAEELPFPSDHFDAAMATFTVHQWTDLGAGLSEMRRVTRGPVILLTCDPEKVQRFWLNEYAPDVLAAEARRYPSVHALRAGLGGAIDVRPVPIPFDCRDGFNEAYYGRPEIFLEEGSRLACSAWSFVDPDVTSQYIRKLRDDLVLGLWDERCGNLRQRAEYVGSLCLIRSY
jgi:SAM-dependent methyltransferase